MKEGNHMNTVPLQITYGLYGFIGGAVLCAFCYVVNKRHTKKFFRILFCIGFVIALLGFILIFTFHRTDPFELFAGGGGQPSLFFYLFLKLLIRFRNFNLTRSYYFAVKFIAFLNLFNNNPLAFVGFDGFYDLVKFRIKFFANGFNLFKPVIF